MRNPLLYIVLSVLMLTGCTDWPRGAAERGDAEAQYNLAVLYEQGRGYPHDLGQAAHWYGLAAEQGYMDAQYNLGSLYADGEGVGQDLAQAAHWYGRAAEQGLREAQHDLAVFYDLGEGVAQDKAEAARLYQAAAEQGLVDSMFNLAILKLEAGDCEAALEWFSKASTEGDEEAQLALSRMYALGRCVEKNMTQAYLWVNRAHYNGNREATVERDRIAEQMSDAELEEAKRLSFDR